MVIDPTAMNKINNPYLVRLFKKICTKLCVNKIKNRECRYLKFADGLLQLSQGLLGAKRNLGLGRALGLVGQDFDAVLENSRGLRHLGLEDGSVDRASAPLALGQEQQGRVQLVQDHAARPRLARHHDVQALQNLSAHFNLVLQDYVRQVVQHVLLHSAVQLTQRVPAMRTQFFNISHLRNHV